MRAILLAEVFLVAAQRNLGIKVEQVAGFLDEIVTFLPTECEHVAHVQHALHLVLHVLHALLFLDIFHRIIPGRIVYLGNI